MPATSRRRSVRFDAPPGLTVRVAQPGLKARIIDIGPGGVGLACNAPLRRGTVHTLTFWFGQRSVTCGARVAHCRRRDDAWQVGLQFVRDRRLAQIEELVDHLTASLIEFS